MDIEKKGGIMNESICQVEGNAKKKKKKSGVHLNVQLCGGIGFADRTSLDWYI